MTVFRFVSLCIVLTFRQPQSLVLWTSLILKTQKIQPFFYGKVFYGHFMVFFYLQKYVHVCRRGIDLKLLAYDE